MTAPRRPRYTFAEYIELEHESREIKHEYVAGEIFAMAGGTVEHAALATALAGLLFNHLRGGPCRAYGSDLQLRIRAAEVATYADVVVVCDPVERDPESPSHVTNPRVVVEILSPTTERYDREQKRLYYQQLDSLREYVLVAQDRHRIEVWRKDGEDWAWSAFEAGAGAPLESIGYVLLVDELYEAAGLA